MTEASALDEQHAVDALHGTEKVASSEMLCEVWSQRAESATDLGQKPRGRDWQKIGLLRLELQNPPAVGSSNQLGSEYREAIQSRVEEGRAQGSADPISNARRGLS